jgi:hypothetical protein
MPFISYGPLNSLLFGIYGNTLRLLNDDNRDRPTYFNVWIAGIFNYKIQGARLSKAINFNDV